MAAQIDDRRSLLSIADIPNIGDEIYALAAEIYPICRSITGAGVVQTLDLLAQQADIRQHVVASGTKVLDWEVPLEWNIRGAYIQDETGKRIVDFADNNLHVLNYSEPINSKMSFDDLKRHLHWLPDHPDLIPYRTSYYNRTWGFCVTQTQLTALEQARGLLEVVIDSTLAAGHLTWGEFYHQGESPDEVLLTTHICHPSLANDNCSGMALLTILARELSRRSTRYSYRLLFIPGTIGAISWLASNEGNLSRIKHGLVVTGVGDGGGPTYKKSRRGDAPIDRAMTHILQGSGEGSSILEFFPYGYDERQFCSPGFNLPVGLFQRSQFSKYSEYHTSADNMSFISNANLVQSLRSISCALDVLERDRAYINLHPKGEPQLGRRGLYAAVGGMQNSWQSNMAMLWVLSLSDGHHSLLDISRRAGVAFPVVAAVAELLEKQGLLRPAG